MVRLGVTRLLARVERLLAFLVEGTIIRWFKPSIEPIHLTRHLERLMEDSVLIGVHGPLAPNYFVAMLDPGTYERFVTALSGMERELEQHLAIAAGRRRLRTLAPFGVALGVDPALPPRRFIAQAAFLEHGAMAAHASGAAVAAYHAPNRAEQTQVMPAVSGQPVATVSATLELRGPDGAVQRIALTGTGCTIGRADDNTVVLSEPAISRHHAIIQRAGDDFVVQDLGSTNGLLVNRRPVRSALLKDGDHLLIGTSELVFRQR